jgi:membrane protein DedA with SNARE-associated domain
MTDTFHWLIARYGLIAVFLGCAAEGESAAILGGFFAHQKVFELWQIFAVAFAGSFVGDTLLFLVGRRFSNHPLVARMRLKPGFAHADRLVRRYPNLFVFANRYIYGTRVVGGVVAGLSGIAASRFLLINGLSALLWATIFSGIGYAFGLGAERLLGAALHEHQRLLIALAGGIACGLAAYLASHYGARRRHPQGE